MNKTEKKRFLRELTKNVLDEMLDDMRKVPDEWDGIELRAWLAARFGRAAYVKMNRARKRNFDNTLATENL